LSGRSATAGWKPIDGVTGEQQAGFAVDEHDVPGRMARGVHDLQVTARKDRPTAGGEPLVGVFPVVEVRALVAGERLLELGDDVVGATAAKQFDLRVHPEHRRVRRDLERRLLERAQPDLAAELPPQRDSLRVVVPVHVRDQELADVAEPGSDALQRRRELLTGGVERPARVDHHQLGAVGDRVHVHRAQRVVRQRQRDAVHPRRGRIDPRLGPVAPGVLAQRLHDAVTSSSRIPAHTLIRY
jgi:hypothetical protein